jgi:hypothetical protein
VKHLGSSRERTRSREILRFAQDDASAGLNH